MPPHEPQLVAWPAWWPRWSPGSDRSPRRFHALLRSKWLSSSSSRWLSPHLALGQDRSQIGDDDERLVTADPAHFVRSQQPPLDVLLGIAVGVAVPALRAPGLDLLLDGGLAERSRDVLGAVVVQS